MVHLYTASIAAGALAASALGAPAVGRELGGIALLTREVVRHA